ncbi:WRKY DNA-binding protein 50 [Actinidia rufa]|uniref:WRKY DNA-binding protein 50 n=1 Tax=Actinidia rufa TaxID=165716 RepID=A0A7J0EL09_9ERIC|nr:WRKY DNA-binding protein 50 [Actinidia rufa]
MDHHRHLQKPNPNSTHLTGNIDTWLDFEVEDYLVLDDGSEESFSSQNMASSDIVTGGFELASAGATSANSNMQVIIHTSKRQNGVKRRKPDHAGVTVAFRTKSELEVMDDGFKWRKYGKKMVKNSPNPR